MKKLILTFALITTSMTSYAVDYKDGDRVSTLNGQLVEVGERNRYHLNAPKFNIGINPFGVMTGIYSGSAALALGEVVALHGDVSYNEHDSEWEMSLGTQLYFKKMFSGVYLEPGVVRKERGNIFGPQVMLGYNWYWDSGMNVSIAAGIGRNLNDSDDTYLDEDDDRIDNFGNGYFKVGYAF